MVRLQLVLIILLLTCLSAGPALADNGVRAKLAMVEASINQIQAQIASLKSQLQAALASSVTDKTQSMAEEGLEQSGDKDMLDMMLEFSDRKAGSTWDQLQAQDTQTGGPQGLEQFSQGFTDTPATGQFDPDGQAMTVGQAPSADQVYDLSAEIAKEKQAQAQTEAGKQEALDKATTAEQDQWGKTLQQLEAARQQQNQQNQARADQLQQEAQQQMAQWQEQVSQGAMTEAEFQGKMDGMQADHDAAMADQEQENQEFLADAFADLMDDPDQPQTVSALGWQEPPAPPRPAWMQPKEPNVVLQSTVPTGERVFEDLTTKPAKESAKMDMKRYGPPPGTKSQEKQCKSVALDTDTAWDQSTDCIKKNCLKPGPQREACYNQCDATFQAFLKGKCPNGKTSRVNIQGGKGNPTFYCKTCIISRKIY